jgi:crotonobetainyl-CoA:carnitine CoA-transferase CaiB-like acyl-CoA transferase
MVGALDGVRVLEFSLIVAGPMCGAVLADMGADVIKVEPPGGEPQRRNRSVVPTESKLYQSFNRGKRGIVVDVSQDAGKEAIYRLMPSIDVVLVNYRYGVADQLGIDYDTLRQYRPDVIYAESTGWGTRGPLASRGCSDVVAQAYSGLMAAEGKLDEDGSPSQITSSAWADYLTAAGSATAICGALFSRTQTGQGQKINSSLLRSALWGYSHTVNREPITDALFSDVTRKRLEDTRAAGGSYADLIEARTSQASMGTQFALYYNGYQAKDGGVILGALTPANRDAFRRVFELEGEHSDSPDYDALDPENERLGEQFKEQIREKMRTHTVAEWIEIFEANGAPAAPVNFPEEVREDPQVQAEGIFVDLVHDLTGEQSVVGPLFEMSGTPTEARAASPPLGRDTREVLLEAGMTAAEVDALYEGGTVA